MMMVDRHEVGSRVGDAIYIIAVTVGISFALVMMFG